jgi:hypothetical protein
MSLNKLMFSKYVIYPEPGHANYTKRLKTPKQHVSAVGRGL